MQRSHFLEKKINMTDVDALSVADLKAEITKAGLNPDLFIEKQDLQRCVRELRSKNSNRHRRRRRQLLLQ